jgi:nitrile hydratase subunit beta
LSLSPGTRVRARLADQTGEVVEAAGQWPLPDDRARGITPPRVETVYSVRFPAAALWGSGTHWVVVDLWESYLEVG